MNRVMLVGVSVVMGAIAMGQNPEADEILKAARYSVTQQQQNLTGNLVKERTKIPVGLFLMKERVQFAYLPSKAKVWERFEMRLKKDRWDLLQMKAGKVSKFPEAKLGQAIEGTDMSYEDLAMHFLYWPNGEVKGEEKVKGQNCWKVRLQKP